MTPRSPPAGAGGDWTAARGHARRLAGPARGELSAALPERLIRQSRLLIAGCGIAGTIAEACVRLGFEHLTHNAAGFVSEAEIVFDTIDFLSLEGIVALHDAGQAQRKPVIAPLSVRWGAAAIYFPPDGTCTFRSIFGLPATGSVGGISYVGQFMRLIDRLEADLSDDVVAAWKRTLTRMDDGQPCPAPHVSVASWAVGSLAAAIAVRVLRAEPVTPAPGMIFLNMAKLCTMPGVNLL